MSEQERSEQLWNRAMLALGVKLVADSWHSGQWSKGYAKSCQADRILGELGFRPGAAHDPASDPDIRAVAAEYLWHHRRDVARNW